MAVSLSKAPSELRKISFLLAAKIPAGATLVSVVAYASRKISGFSTTLNTGSAAEASTLALNANPGIGALIIVEPGTAVEETFKVSNVTGSVPWTVTLSHTAEFAHSGTPTVNYEPGVSSRFLVSTAPTPVGTQVFPEVQFGADGQTYRVSVIGTLDNGEFVEEEADVVVTEIAPTETRTVQVDEWRDFAYGFDDSVALSGSGLSSAIAWASREETAQTTLSAAVAINDTTIQLTANPGIGALLTINPTGNTQEKLKVSNISGAEPSIIATVNPTPDFIHNNGETVNYEPGVSTRLLSSTTATISGNEAFIRKRRGAAGKTYRFTLLGTLANGEKIHHAGHVSVVET